MAKALFSCVLRQLGVSPLFRISLSTLGYLFLTSDVSLAQVTSDGTVNTQVNQNGNVAEITGGETRGGNLFHSFRDFSVSTGNEAAFLNANDIANIFSRVTGGNISNIDGLIRANGSANLFLINPAGILFGENARLDVGGSFLGSTASGILFEDGEFSATDLEKPPVLTINAPIGLNLRDNPGDIVNQSRALDSTGQFILGLQVQPGKNLALIGGDVSLEESSITAPGGRVELGGLTAAGTVNLNSDGSLSFPDSIPRGDISLAGALVSVAGTQGGTGSIGINAKNLKLAENSRLQGGAFKQTGLPDTQAGDIILNATDLIAIDSSEVFNTVGIPELSGIGNAGNIIITTGSLSLTNGADINSSTYGIGNGGNITVNAADNIALDASSTILSNVGESGVGNGGQIKVDTDTLNLTNGANINSSTSGNGDGGNVIITAKQLSVRDSAGLYTDTFSAGNAGNLTINVENFTVQNSQVSASTLGKGDAGNLTVNASESVELSGEIPAVNGNRGFPGGLFAQIDIAEGKGGNLTINTQRLSVSDGSKIQVATFGKGDAGELTIRASQIDVIDTEAKDNIFFTGIFAGIQQDRFGSTELAEGNAGKLTIETDRLSIIGSGRVEANNSGIGNAGDISITAKDLVEVVGVNNGTPSFIGAEVAPPDGTNPITPELISGDGGNVTINTGQLIVKDGGRVSASTYGKGDSGDLTINASDSISLSGEGSGLFAQADPKATGKGGSLNIQTGNLDLSDRAEISASTASNEGGNINLKIDDTLTMRNNSLISAQALKNADGGNVNIDANFIVAFPNQINGNGSDIIARAAEGDGGRININAESLLGIQERKAIDNNQTNDIDASSEFGLDGTVSIFTPDINPVQGATELPSNVVEAEQTTEQACQANREAAAKNGLVINGKGGIPAPPDQPLTSQNLLINGEVNSASAIPEPIETSRGKIQLARGIKVTKDGQVILTPYPTNNAGERIPEGGINCGV